MKDRLEELFRKRHRWVSRWAFRRARPYIDVEGLVMDSFHVLLEKADQFEAMNLKEEQLFSYWISCVQNNLFNAHTKHQRSIVLSIEIEEAEEDKPEDGFCLVSEDRPIPEAAESRIFGEKVRDFVMALKQEQREVLVLFHFQGYSENDIAERLGCNVRTVKGRMRMARQKLRQVMRDDPLFEAPAVKVPSDRPYCLGCGSAQLTRGGYNRKGARVYKCSDCGKCVIWSSLGNGDLISETKADELFGEPPGPMVKHWVKCACCNTQFSKPESEMKRRRSDLHFLNREHYQAFAAGKRPDSTSEVTESTPPEAKKIGSDESRSRKFVPQSL